LPFEESPVHVFHHHEIDRFLRESRAFPARVAKQRSAEALSARVQVFLEAVEGVHVSAAPRRQTEARENNRNDSHRKHDLFSDHQATRVSGREVRLSIRQSPRQACVGSGVTKAPDLLILRGHASIHTCLP